MKKFKNTKIKIFCEKSKSIGNGHFIRSKRLYDYLKSKNFSCSFEINNSSEQINKKINLAKNKVILILDYKNYRKINIYKNTKILKTIVVENLNKKIFYKNLNTYPLDIQYGLNSGPEFYQYPKEFYKKDKNFDVKNLKKKKISILIVQGGTDANNNISMLVKRLSKKKLNFEAKFFVKTNNSEDMKKIKLLKNVYVIGKVKNIISVLKKINLAISACGGFAYELGYFGIPTIHVSSEKREIIRAKLLKKKNLGEFFYPKNINQIFNEINKIYYEKTYREMLIKNRINFFKKKNKFLNLLIKI
tara:strand:+ start:86 stop:994 length:909 start_codon:yes stop_codon:yes gene_type:complete